MVLLLLVLVRVLALKKFPCGYGYNFPSEPAAETGLSARGVNAAAALLLHHQVCSYSAVHTSQLRNMHTITSSGMLEVCLRSCIRLFQANSATLHRCVTLVLTGMPIHSRIPCLHVRFTRKWHCKPLVTI